MSRAYQVGVKNDPRFGRIVFADSAGKAKYYYLRDLRECYEDMSFAHLTCRALGNIPVPPTPREIAQAECDRFNASHPVGMMIRYWSWTKDGEPTGTAPIRHHATVMSSGNPVIWLEGVRSCISLTHVEVAQ